MADELTLGDILEAVSNALIDTEIEEHGFSAFSTRVTGEEGSTERGIEVELVGPSVGPESCVCPEDEDEDACDFCLDGGLAMKTYLTVRLQLTDAVRSVG